MSIVVRRFLVFSVCVAVVACQLPPIARAAGGLERGAPTARAAAGGRNPSATGQKRPAPLALGALEYARVSSDTTGLTFPDEENDHLKRDIAVFVIVSAFVAIFIIKLFLEGDDPEEPDTDSVRDTPPTPLFIAP